MARPKKVVEVKRGPGRPKGSGAKRGRKPKIQAEAVPVAVNRTAVKVVPTAADLIARLRPAIKAIDSVLEDCEAAGVDISMDGTMPADFEHLFVDLMLALARAP